MQMLTPRPENDLICQSINRDQALLVGANDQRLKQQVTAMEQQMGLSREVDRKKSRQKKLDFNFHAPVKRIEPKSWLHFTVLSIATICCLQQLATISSQAEAKTHHSKRQAPIVLNAPSFTGRENTNWWNIWWQQYINEAVQPTTRPIVAVSFNGQTINLSDQTDLAGSSNVVQLDNQPTLDKNRDVDTNLVSNNLVSSLDNQNPMEDIGRNEKLRLVASSELPDNMHPFAEKQMLLVQRKSAQQQSNWQSVKPTIIQASTTMRDARLNRQASMYQTSGTEERLAGAEEEQPINGQMGIQMRTVISRQQDMMTKRPLVPNVSSNLMLDQQQQQKLVDNDVRFEQQQQQQHQMVDYSEETEPELDNVDQGRQTETSKDSSSSSMMMVDQPAEIKPVVMGDIALQSQFGDREAERPLPKVAIPTIGLNKSQTLDQRSSIQEQPDQQEQQQQIEQMGATKQPERATAVSQQTPGTTQLGMTTFSAGTSMRPPSVMGAGMTSFYDNDNIAQTTTTTIATPTTTKAPLSEQATVSMNFNETPITLRDEQQRQQQQEVGKVSTPTGRVELENGRPATGTRQTTTTSVRLPSSTTQTKSTTTSLAPSDLPSSKSTSQGMMMTKITTPTAPTTFITTTPAPTVKLSQTTRAQKQQTEISSPGRPFGRTATPMTISTTTAITTTTSSLVGSELEREPKRSSEPSTGDQSVSTQSALDTTTAATMPSGAGEGATDEDDTTDGDEGSDGSIRTSSGTNLINAAGESSDSDDSADDNDDTDDDSADNDTDNGSTPQELTSTTSTTASPMMTTRQLQKGNEAGQPVMATTQQPTFTTIDIERLPKQTSSPSQAPSTNMVTRASTSIGPTPQVTEATSSRDEVTRIRPLVQQQGNANLVMMSFDQSRASTISGETAITMPMDTLMKMMMNQIAEQDNERLTQTTQLPPTTTTKSVLTQTSASKISALKALSDAQQTTVRPVAQVEMTQSSLITSSTTRKRLMNGAAAGEGDNLVLQTNEAGLNVNVTKKRLQPPPTTSAPSDGPVKATIASEDPFQKTLIVSLEPASMTPDEEAAGREPKIELLNLDLMPIQRIMSSQLESNGEKARTEKDKLNNIKTAQPATKNQLEGQQLPVDETRGGQLIQSDRRPIQTLDQFMGEVEPGMRLRPATGSAISATKTGSATQAGGNVFMRQSGGRMNTPTMNGLNNQQANTIYMVMMNNLPSEMADSKKPGATIVSTTSAPIQQRVTASLKSGQLTSEAPMTIMQRQQVSTISNNSQVTKQATTSIPPLDKTTSQTQQQQSSGPIRLSSSPQTRITQLIPMTTTKTTLPSTKSPITRIMSTLNAASNLQQTTMRANMASSSTTSRPKFTTSPREMEQRQKDSAKMSTMRMIEFADKEQQQQRQPQQQQFSSTTSSMIKKISDKIGQSDLLSNLPTITITSGPDQPVTTISSIERSTTIKSTSRTNGTQIMAPSEISPSTGSVLNETITTIQAPMSTSSIRQQQQIEEERRKSNEPIPTQPIATTISRDRLQLNGDSIIGGGNNQIQLERIRQPSNGERRPQQVATKTTFSSSKINKSNLTSSFISSRLRTDFNKLSRVQVEQQQRIAQTNAKLTSQGNRQMDEGQARSPTNQESPAIASTLPPPPPAGMAQNMAIRQFGGANRMSVMTNQPVPFGRPAAMTIQSGQSRSKNNFPARFELPSFEYGPSIVVRRPDEPLANGQIPNCTLTGKNFCVLTKDYPMNEVRQAVERSFRSVRIMYEELQTVSDQELHKDDFNATNNQAASGKFACQTQVEMMRPGWAKDEITKEWMLVVNTDVFPQRVRTESCAQPNTPCEFIAPFYDSTCQQRYSLHRMIAIDPHDPSRSPQVAVFRFPAGCVCRVHPIRKTTTMIQTTTPPPTTIISSSTSKSIRRR